MYQIIVFTFMLNIEVNVFSILNLHCADANMIDVFVFAQSQRVPF